MSLVDFRYSAIILGYLKIYEKIRDFSIVLSHSGFAEQNYVAPYEWISFWSGFLENDNFKWKLEENNFYLFFNFLSDGCGFRFLEGRKWYPLSCDRNLHCSWKSNVWTVIHYKRNENLSSTYGSDWWTRAWKLHKAASKLYYDFGLHVSDRASYHQKCGTFPVLLHSFLL